MKSIQPMQQLRTQRVEHRRCRSSPGVANAMPTRLPGSPDRDHMPMSDCGQWLQEQRFAIGAATCRKGRGGDHPGLHRHPYGFGRWDSLAGFVGFTLAAFALLADGFFADVFPLFTGQPPFCSV